MKIVLNKRINRYLSANKNIRSSNIYYDIACEDIVQIREEKGKTFNNEI